MGFKRLLMICDFKYLQNAQNLTYNTVQQNCKKSLGLSFFRVKSFKHQLENIDLHSLVSGIRQQTSQILCRVTYTRFDPVELKKGSPQFFLPQTYKAFLHVKNKNPQHAQLPVFRYCKKDLQYDWPLSFSALTITEQISKNIDR